MKRSNPVSSYTPRTTRDARRYKAGWADYEAGIKFYAHANPHWQRGWRDARDAGANIGRNSSRVGFEPDNEKLRGR